MFRFGFWILPAFLVAANLSFAATDSVPAAVSKRVSLFDAGTHCVAYRAHKKLFLVASVQVIGKSCDILTQVVPEVDGLYRIEMGLPLTSLKSGEAERDQDVAKLLGAQIDPELHFVTESKTQAEWQNLLKQEKATIKGEIRFSDRVKLLTADVILSKSTVGVEIDGVIKTSFKDLELKPPQMGGGLFAKVREDLELHFHFLGEKTMGAEAILPATP